MTLKELLERECRFYGAINYDGSIDDAVTLHIGHDMLQKHKQELTSLHDGLYIGNTRVFINGWTSGNIVQISLGGGKWKKES